MKELPYDLDVFRKDEFIKSIKHGIIWRIPHVKVRQGLHSRKAVIPFKYLPSIGITGLDKFHGGARSFTQAIAISCNFELKIM